MLFDDRKPPLSTERSDLTWGTHDTYLERELEDLDLPPSRLLLRAAAGAASAHDAHGVDTRAATRDVASVAPQHRRRPAAAPSDHPAAGPDFPDAAA